MTAFLILKQYIYLKLFKHKFHFVIIIRSRVFPEFQYEKEPTVNVDQRPVGLSKEPGLEAERTNMRASLGFGQPSTTC